MLFRFCHDATNITSDAAKKVFMVSECVHGIKHKPFGLIPQILFFGIIFTVCFSFEPSFAVAQYDIYSSKQ